MAKATDYYDPQQTRLFNAGYSHGYYRRGAVLSDMVYLRGLLAGAEDREADERDMASGQLDGLSESEREFLYGEEERGVHYR
jgi:hypothetical protein